MRRLAAALVAAFALGCFAWAWHTEWYDRRFGCLFIGLALTSLDLALLQRPRTRFWGWSLFLVAGAASLSVGEGFGDIPSWALGLALGMVVAAPVGLWEATPLGITTAALRLAFGWTALAYESQPSLAPNLLRLGSPQSALIAVASVGLIEAAVAGRVRRLPAWGGVAVILGEVALTWLADRAWVASGLI